MNPRCESCGKIAYDSAAEARRVATELMRRTGRGKRLNSYRCHMGAPYWHVGNDCTSTVKTIRQRRKKRKRRSKPRHTF